MVGPDGTECLFSPAIPGSSPSGTGVYFVGPGLAARLHRFVSVVANGYELGEIAAGVCQQHRGKDWTGRTSGLHQPVCRSGICRPLRFARTGAGGRSPMALGGAAATFANRLLFGF